MADRPALMLRSRSWRRTALAAAGVLALAGPVLAQGWSWPWENQKPPPVPREPVYRTPPGAPPPPAGPYGAPGGAPPPAYSQVPSNRPPICLQLEQRLAQEATRGAQSRDQLPRLEAEMRIADRTYQQGQAQLERNDCFDYFLFSKTLRRTRTCVDLAGQVETAQRRLGEMEAQRQQIMGTGGRSYQDDIIRELARNNCGASYQQEASKRSNPFSSIWQDDDTSYSGGGQFGNLPFATYRTICVRLCDGYYFPVSFSTLPNYFDRDADVCQSKCAAPSELFYHQNPGGAVEGAVSHKSKQVYSQLRSAFRYRKEYVQGCSCKQAEYTPSGPDRRAEAPPAPVPTAAVPRR